MNKKIFLVFLFLINLNFIFSILECEQMSNPKNASECNNLSSKSSYPDYCCFYKLFNDANDNDTFCRTIPYSAIYKDLNYENIDGKLYEVNCSNRNEATLLEQCGKKNEGTSLESCKKYSNGVNSCCYIKGNNEISRGCYWLGTKYEGKTTWAGVEMECNMSFLKYSLFYLNFIIFVLF